MTDASTFNPRLLDELTGVVSAAAAAVMAARAGTLAARLKADLSPVTAADEASEAVILRGLAGLLPGVPVVSEEAVSRGAKPRAGREFVLVDPVDGTRELVAGRDEFTINLAIVADGRPVAGLIAAAALAQIWRAAEGLGAERLRLAPGAPAGAARESTRIRPRPWEGMQLRAVVSRSHLDGQTDAWLRRLRNVERTGSGSAVKFCRVAEGTADVYPRLAPMYEWDVAAGDAIVTIAGGSVATPAGTPITYGRNEDLIVSGFIAWGDPSVPGRQAARQGH